MSSSINYPTDLSAQAAAALRALFASSSFGPGAIVRERAGADLSLELGGAAGKWTLICEIKTNGQPRYIRAAALQAREHALRASEQRATYPVVIAPFISRESGAICQELGVGYLDLAGNCRLAFGAVYIEKSVATNPFKEKREQRSMFAPKSARVLRIMMGEPSREWKVAELAERAAVSYGQVSKVRRYLLDREWASGSWGGVRLSKPRELLDAWKQVYKPLRTRRSTYYTLLHGESLQRAIREACRSDRPGHALLSSYSAARWLAPYARISGEYFYADAMGEQRLKDSLRLELVAKGENVIIDLASDEGVFQESIEAAPALRCTSLAQTYLDLVAAGERGAEAAEHLFNLCIAPKWQAKA